jgi:hypothetical protein
VHEPLSFIQFVLPANIVTTAEDYKCIVFLSNDNKLLLSINDILLLSMPIQSSSELQSCSFDIVSLTSELGQMNKIIGKNEELIYDLASVGNELIITTKSKVFLFCGFNF